MSHLQLNPTIVVALVLVLAITTLAGCSQPVEAGAAANSGGYASALNTTYEDALDVRSQLALGMIELEGTADAVTRTEAADLLSLWQALAGSALQDHTERTAVLAQIEATMTAGQMAAIAAMQLTGKDVQTWLESQQPAEAAPDGQMPGGTAQAPPVGDTSTMQAQASWGGNTDGASYLLVQAAVTLLSRSEKVSYQNGSLLL